MSSGTNGTNGTNGTRIDPRDRDKRPVTRGKIYPPCPVCPGVDVPGQSDWSSGWNSGVQDALMVAVEMCQEAWQQKTTAEIADLIEHDRKVLLEQLLNRVAMDRSITRQWYTLTYPDGTRTDAFFPDGATLAEAQQWPGFRGLAIAP